MKKIKDIFLNLNRLDLKIMKNGLIFSLAVSILGAVTLFMNMVFLHNIIFFEVGLAIIKLSFYLAVEFIVCGFIVDKILFENI